MERLAGIEPSWPAYWAGAAPGFVGPGPWPCLFICLPTDPLSFAKLEELVRVVRAVEKAD